jgi:hypothetical protein
MGYPAGLQLGLPPLSDFVLRISPSASSADFSLASLSAGSTLKQKLSSSPNRRTRRRRGRLECRSFLLDISRSIVLADMDPGSMQTVLLTAGVVTATTISLYFGLKVGLSIL